MDEKDIENQIAKEKAAEDSVLGDGTDTPQSESSHLTDAITYPTSDIII